ncbi:MAG: pilus assembly protein PilM [Parachlamydiaceae bacterium]|nr:pilus assembly protein PilM [Parachlamydiaceae bacterium]
MFDKPSAFHAIGLDIDDTHIKVAQLSFAKGQPTVEHLLSVDTENSSGQTIFEGPTGRTLSDQQQYLIVSALDSKDILIRPLEIKLKKEKDIDAVLAFQTEPLIPYPVENAILDRITLETTPEGTQINVIAARKDHVESHISFWKARHIEPEVISSVPFALSSFSKQFSSTQEAHFIVNIGEAQTTCVLVREGKLLAAQATAIGATVLKDPQTMDQWRVEVTRILFALAKQRREQETVGILFTGLGATNNALTSAITEILNKPALALADKAQSVSTEQLQEYAVAIGAGLSGLPTQHQINFRQQELSYPHPWNRLKQPLALYFILCCCVAAAIYFFTLSYSGHREDDLRYEYVELLASMNKTYSAFEGEFATKTGTKSEITPTIESLSQSDLLRRLALLQKEMQDNPSLFPFLPNTPRVSDVLAWLSTHPVATGKSHDGQPPLQIESFNYAMVKRPEQKKPQEKYQVKVELEFSSPTPMIAREFHDALIAPNDIVDPKGEVKWSSNRGKYRTSFFLKDKTVYP